MILEQLEERIVLDAAVDSSAQDNSDQNQPDTQQECGAGQAPPGGPSDAPQPQGERASDPIGEIFNQDLYVVLISNALDQVEAVSESAVADAHVITYDGERDGLSEINSVLEDLTTTTGMKIGHIAVFCHGGEGVFRLSYAEQYSVLDVQSDPGVWRDLGDLLTPDARIDLYGCDIGRGDLGNSLVSALAAATDATVWASDDATGTGPDADWRLETHSGESHRGYLIDASLLAHYDILLADPIINGAEIPTISPMDEDHTSNTFTLTAHDADKVDPAWVHFVVDDVAIDSGSESTTNVTNGSLHALGPVAHDGNGAYTQQFEFTPDPDFYGTVNLSYYFVSHCEGLSDSGQSLGSGNTASVALGDLNGDGHIDIVEGNQGQGLDGESNVIWFNNGEGVFTASLQTLGNYQTSSLAIGDLDGDLDLDIVEGNGLNKGEANRIWFNGGDGFFEQSNQELGSTRTTDIVLGDLDGDLDLDIVEANGWEGPIQIRLNDGHGVFSEGEQLEGTPYEETSTVALADVDGDLDLDILQGRVNNSILVWINDGHGSFTDSGLSLGSGTTADFAVGNLDGANQVDFVAAKSDGPSEIWLSDGAGGFSNTTQDIGVEKTYSVDLEDLDKDGDLDLITGVFQHANHVWRNNGSGTFVMGSDDIGSGYAYSVAAGDLDGDPYPDLVIGNYLHSANQVYFGSQDQSSNSEVLTITVDPVEDPAEILDSEIPNVVVDEDQTSGIFTLTAHDVDLPDPTDVEFTIDGIKIDNSGPSAVAVTDGVLNAQGAMAHDGNGVYTQQFTFTPDPDYHGDINLSLSFDQLHESAGGKTLTITVKSVDDPSTMNDIPLQTAYQGSTTSDFTLTAQDADKTDANTVNFVVNGNVIDNSGASVIAVTGGTLNVLGGVTHDGNGCYSQEFSFTPDPDFTGTLTMDCHFVTEQPQGTFWDSLQPIGAEKTWSVALGDLDGDGDPDLVIGNLNQPDEVWFNNGFGFFTDSGQRLGENMTHKVVLGDLDGDGDLDIAEANDLGPDVIWFNNGEGLFTQSVQLDSGSNTFDIALGRLDGDADLDLAQGRHDQYNNLYKAETCLIWTNDGSGLFTDSGQAIGPIITWAVAVGKLDGDGSFDLVDAGDGGGWVWLNNGAGVFPPGDATQYDFGNVRDIAIGDVDGDTDLDLVFGVNAEHVKVWLNNGSGEFSDSGIDLDFATGFTCAVALGDVDGDKDLDIVSGNRNAYDRVAVNDGSGGFTDSGQELGEKAAETTSVVLCDLDVDGDLDLVQGNTGDPNQIFFNGAASSESKPLVIEVSVEPVEPLKPGEESYGKPSDQYQTPDFGAQEPNEFDPTLGPTPTIQTNLLTLVESFLPPEPDRGDSPEFNGRQIPPEAPTIPDYLHQALFGETQESQDQAWNNLLSFVSAKKAGVGEELLGLQAFLLRLQEWQVGKTLDEILLVFNAEEIKLSEWFSSLITSVDDLLGSQQTSTAELGEDFQKPPSMKSTVFDMNEMRVADLFSSHLGSHGQVDSHEPHVKPSNACCRIFDPGFLNFVDAMTS